MISPATLLFTNTCVGVCVYGTHTLEFFLGFTHEHTHPWVFFGFTHEHMLDFLVLHINALNFFWVTSLVLNITHSRFYIWTHTQWTKMKMNACIYLKTLNQMFRNSRSLIRDVCSSRILQIDFDHKHTYTQYRLLGCVLQPI